MEKKMGQIAVLGWRGRRGVGFRGRRGVGSTLLTEHE